MYKPGNVKLRPEVLLEGQQVARKKLGLGENDLPFHFVFHGGSGSEKEKIEEALRYGVIKIDGEVGNKKVYDPRSYLKKAEQGMSERVVEACQDLHSVGSSLGQEIPPKIAASCPDRRRFNDADYREPQHTTRGGSRPPCWRSSMRQVLRSQE